MQGSNRAKKTEASTKTKSAIPLETRPFWQDLEAMLGSELLNEHDGHFSGSLSGESWKAFLKTIRDETVSRLNAYRQEGYVSQGFQASSLHPYYETRKKIERDYLRSLADLYCSAERAYKTLSG